MGARGKKTPFYRRGKIQPLPCSQPAQSGTTARAVVTQKQCNGARPRAGSTAGAVLPLPPAVLPLGVAARGYSEAEQDRWGEAEPHQRYYRSNERYYRLQAVVPHHCRSTTAKEKQDTRRISASGSCSGSGGQKYRTKRYYRSEERYYHTTTALLPINNKMAPEEKTPSGTRCSRPRRKYRLSVTTVVPSGTTAWVQKTCPNKQMEAPTLTLP